jgi:hypothetical protein
MQIIIPDDVTTVPGLGESVALVTQIQNENRFEHGASLTPADIVLVCATVLAVSRPAVHAELLADMSDHLAEHGHGALAGLLDDVSGQMRKVLYGG